MEKKQGVIIALLAVCVFFSVIIAAMYLTSDRTAPVITVDESKVKPYSAEQGEEVLKSYAKAVDAKDGDVSSSIVIENIYIMPDMTRAKVIFAARDHNNNVSKYSYMIAYEASQEEIEAKEQLTQAETTRLDSRQNTHGSRDGKDRDRQYKECFKDDRSGKDNCRERSRNNCRRTKACFIGNRSDG